MNILGYNISQKIADKRCGLTINGTCGFDLAAAFRWYGFRDITKVFNNSEKAWRWLIIRSSYFHPIILGTHKDTHWTLLLTANDTHAQIIDPIMGVPEKVRRSALLKRWRFIENNNTTYFGMCFIPYKPKAKKAIRLRRLLNKTTAIK